MTINWTDEKKSFNSELKKAEIKKEKKQVTKKLCHSCVKKLLKSLETQKLLIEVNTKQKNLA